MLSIPGRFNGSEICVHSPRLGLIAWLHLCCHGLEILANILNRDPHFDFALGSANLYSGSWAPSISTHRLQVFPSILWPSCRGAPTWPWPSLENSCRRRCWCSSSATCPCLTALLQRGSAELGLPLPPAALCGTTRASGEQVLPPPTFSQSW